MQTLDTFFPWVIPFASGCTDPMAQQAIRDAAIELCEHSGVIQQWLDPVILVEGVAAYDLDAPYQQTATMVRAATIDGAPLGLLPNILVTGPAGDDGTPTVVYSEAPDDVIVLALESPPDAYSAGKTLRVRVSLKPEADASQLNDMLFNHWREAIAAGALMRLYGMHGQPFANERGASTKRIEFELAKGRARIEASRGRVAADLRVTPNPFA